jgi:hypothetical protein
MKPDFINQIGHVSMTFSWDENGLQNTKTWEFPMRYFFRYELEHLIHRSKLKLIDIFGDFQEHPLGPDSKEFVVVCQREE